MRSPFATAVLAAVKTVLARVQSLMLTRKAHLAQHAVQPSLALGTVPKTYRDESLREENLGATSKRTLTCGYAPLGCNSSCAKSKAPDAQLRRWPVSGCPREPRGFGPLLSYKAPPGAALARGKATGI